MNVAHVRLTSLAHGGGCGCKLAPAVLQQLLADQPVAKVFPQLLVGTETGDDAAVWLLEGETCVIATTDFFMPIVDDPADFGRIAAQTFKQVMIQRFREDERNSLYEEFSGRVGELEAHKDQSIIVVCRAGVRSTTGAAILIGLGFEHVANLKGGMIDWSDQRLPVERSSHGDG